MLRVLFLALQQSRPSWAILTEGLIRNFGAVILLPAHPASFAHNFVSGMQSFYFMESQDAMVLQTCH